ncbi:AlpA family transcriptional regulator [Buttiauxella sp. HR94]|nr:AlpA family transcriptional regulator [Buttiauxella sp. HR94]
MSHSLIRLSEVQKRTGYSKAWIYRLLKDNRFPQSVKIGSRAIAFVESEVDEWICERIAERNALISSKPQL